MEKRLERIIITGLFNRFNYNIDLNNGDNVAILSAPNGCGKTTIFNIIDFMFMSTVGKYRKVSNIPFASCECVLSNGKKIMLEESEESEQDKKRKRRIGAISGAVVSGMVNRMPARLFVLKVVNADGKVADSIDLFNIYMEIMNRSMHEMDYNEDVIELDLPFSDMHPRDRMIMQRNALFSQKVKMLLDKNDCSLTIKFIQADRLHSNNSIYLMSDRGRYRGEEYPDRRDPLTEACNEIYENYYMKLRDEFHRLQNEASDSLPKQYLQAKKSTVSIEKFKEKWNSYIDDIKKFYEIGMLDSDETILSDDELDKAYEEKREFLNVYLNAFEKTLAPLRKEYDRMKLFTDILNKRNKGTLKEMKYGKNGIDISVAGSPLDINCLSSGEKHDFIMFYNLIFKAEKGSLVFIDEPEISLHINWQEEYIDRLLEICKINDLQAFVATHSPNIVNEHFDLMVERGVHDASK